MPDLETRVRHYAEHLDELAAPVTFEELIDREVEPVTMPEVERRVLATRRRAWVAAAAAVLVLLLIGGAALLLGNLGTEPDLIDEPTTTTIESGEPTTTTESIPPPEDLTGLSINSIAAGADIFAPTIGVDGVGNPVVVYQHGSGSLEVETAQIEIVHCADPACAAVASRNTIDYTGAEVNVFTAFGLDGSPILIIAPFEQSPTLFRCNEPGCSDYTTSSLPSDMPIGPLVVSPEGNPAMLTGGREPGTHQLVACSDPACSEYTANVLDLPQGWGWARMMYGADGLPLTVHIANNAEEEAWPITALHCGDAICSPAGTIVTHLHDATDDTGDPALMIGSDGRPLITYGNRRLQMLTCGDAACTTVDSINAVGSRGAIGYRTPVPGPGGNPMIVYGQAPADSEWERPMLAVCSDPTCATGTFGRIDDLPTIWIAAHARSEAGLAVAYASWEELWTASCTGDGCLSGLIEPEAWNQAPLPEPSTPAFGPVMGGWARVPHDPAVFGPGGGGGFYSVFETNSGLLATGDVCEWVDGNSICDAGIWLSNDGANWEMAVTGTQLGGRVNGIADGATGLVGVGSRCPPEGSSGPCEAAIWTSPDGRTWNPAPADRETFGCPDEPECDFGLSVITRGGPGLVAWGGGYGVHSIWTSSDSTVWEPAELDGTDTVIEDIVALGARLIAVGTTYTEIYNEAGEWVDYTEDLAVYISGDGLAWSRVNDPSFQGGSVRLTEAWARGLTVTGMVCDENWNCTRQVWNSPNGFDWTRTPLDLGVEDARGMFSMVDGGPGLIGAGTWSDQLGDVSTTLFWTSSDGVTWEVREGDPEVFTGGAGINDFAWLDGRLIGLGGSPVDNAPAVWIRTP